MRAYLDDGVVEEIEVRASSAPRVYQIYDHPPRISHVDGVTALRIRLRTLHLQTVVFPDGFVGPMEHDDARWVSRRTDAWIRHIVRRIEMVWSLGACAATWPYLWLVYVAAMDEAKCGPATYREWPMYVEDSYADDWRERWT